MSGTLKEGVTSDAIDGLLRDIPMVTPTQDQPQPWSSRIWFRQAMRALHQAGILNCTRIDLLEVELDKLANYEAVGVQLGRPYKVMVSQYSA